MNISGWEYDFSSLPHANREAPAPSLFESPHASLCLVIHSANEDGNGYAALLKNKQAPELALSAEKQAFPSVPPFFAASSETVALLTVVTEKTMGRSFDVTLIIDLAKNRFSFAPFYASDERRLYPMTEEKGKIFLLVPDGTKRCVSKLKHYPLSRLGSFEKVRVTSNLLGHVLFEPVF